MNELWWIDNYYPDKAIGEEQMKSNGVKFEAKKDGGEFVLQRRQLLLWLLILPDILMHDKIKLKTTFIQSIYYYFLPSLNLLWNSINFEIILYF